MPDETIRAIECALNTRPRKRLGWQTPLEVFTEMKVLRLEVECTKATITLISTSWHSIFGPTGDGNFVSLVEYFKYTQRTQVEVIAFGKSHGEHDRRVRVSATLFRKEQLCWPNQLKKQSGWKIEKALSFGDL